jgi:hypothetical protein
MAHRFLKGQLVSSARICIFCSNPANSREHIWANWLKDYVPRTQINYDEARIWVNADGRKEPSLRHRAGDPRSRSLRIVCAACNNGWMSRMQERAKPILVPLIRGEDRTLDAKEQGAVSGWAALLVIIAEYAHRDWVSVPVVDRAWIKSSSLAPPNWLVWAGRFIAPHGESRMSRSVFPIVSNAEFATLAGREGVRLFNGQASTFLVGQLLVHTLSAPRRLRFTLDPKLELKLRLICPPRRQVEWPPGAISEDEYVDLTQAVRQRIFWRTGLGSPT